jgi:hypothetical protein
MTRSPWEYYAALLPICFEDRRVGSDVETTPVSGRPILAEDAANQAERRRFLEALLNISWLPPKVRNAIKRELGRSPLEEDAGITMALTLTHRALINERKARMRRNGDRPHGGIHEAAIEEIAREQGMSVAALKWRLRQYKER